MIEAILPNINDISEEMRMFNRMFSQGPNPIFYPSKHNKISYAAQNHAAKKRKNKKTK